jgi:uncharacterized membrane protein YgcG
MNGIAHIARRHPLIATTVVATLLLACAAPAAAQAPNQWRMWIGCWSGAPPRLVDLAAEPQQLCIVPADGAAAADMVTVTGSKVVSRERIAPDGQRHPGERDGCSGWQSARWSADGQRLYLQSEYMCANAAKRSTTAVMAIANTGDWLDVSGLSVNERVGVRVLRHRPSPPLPTLPSDIAAAAARDPREPARLASLLPIGDAEVVEASKYVNGAVIEAWLAETRQAFTIDAARLKALAAAGVDARVIDILVALSYPQAFSIRPSPATTGALAIDAGSGPPPVLLGEPGLIGGSFLDCNPYSYALPLYGCPAFYSSAFAFGLWDYYSGGWWTGGGGGIIIEPSPPSPPPSHGQVVNGKGYVSGDSATRGSSTSSGSSASSGSSSSGSTSSGASAGSSGGGRTAVPR